MSEREPDHLSLDPPDLRRGDAVTHRHWPRSVLEPWAQWCVCLLEGEAWTEAGQLCPCGDVRWHGGGGARA